MQLSFDQETTVGEVYITYRIADPQAPIPMVSVQLEAWSLLHERILRSHRQWWDEQICWAAEGTADIVDLLIDKRRIAPVIRPLRAAGWSSVTLH